SPDRRAENIGSATCGSRGTPRPRELLRDQAGERARTRPNHGPHRDLLEGTHVACVEDLPTPVRSGTADHATTIKEDHPSHSQSYAASSGREHDCENPSQGKHRPA